MGDILTYMAGAATALGASWFQHWLSDQSKAKTDREFQVRLIKALRAEILAVVELNRQGIEASLDAVTQGKFLETKLFITQDYFTVFNTNCSQLGKLDPVLSTELISLYMLMKAAVDNYRIHNSYLEEHEEEEDAVLKSGILRTKLINQTNLLKDLKKKGAELTNAVLLEMNKQERILEEKCWCEKTNYN